MTIKTYSDCDKSALSIASEEGGSGLSGRAESDGATGAAWRTTIAVDSRLLTPPSRDSSRCIGAMLECEKEGGVKVK
jgi:hypothetical protein